MRFSRVSNDMTTVEEKWRLVYYGECSTSKCYFSYHNIINIIIIIITIVMFIINIIIGIKFTKKFILKLGEYRWKGYARKARRYFTVS